VAMAKGLATRGQGALPRLARANQLARKIRRVLMEDERSDWSARRKGDLIGHGGEINRKQVGSKEEQDSLLRGIALVRHIPQRGVPRVPGNRGHDIHHVSDVQKAAHGRRPWRTALPL